MSTEENLKVCEISLKSTKQSKKVLTKDDETTKTDLVLINESGSKAGGEDMEVVEEDSKSGQLMNVFIGMDTVMLPITVYNVIVQQQVVHSCITLPALQPPKNLNVLQQSVVVHSNTEFNRRNDVLRQSKKSNKFNNRVHNPAPVAVARRNARERNRVKQVNNGFATLQQHIPSMILSKYDSGRPNSNGVAKKLSKVETLRMAVEYIRSLENLLASSPPPNTTSSEGSVENHSNVDDFNFTDDSLSLSSQMQEDSNTSNQYFEFDHNRSHGIQSPNDRNLAPLSTDDSLLIENNINFTQLINAPGEIILESESLYEPTFNNNNSNQNRNFVVMKPDDSSPSIVDCNGTNVIIWWQQQQEQQPNQN